MSTAAPRRAVPSLPTHATMLGSVLRVAARGWRLLPCAPHTKKPVLRDWTNLASSDAETIHNFANRNPGCNWGVACGPGSGVWVLDVDGDEGAASLLALIEQHGREWTQTLSVTTARGRHLYYRWPENSVVRNDNNGKVAPGLHVKGKGGQALIPPSIHPSGAVYQWATPLDAPILDAPPWLLQKVNAPPQRTSPSPAAEMGILPEHQRNDGLTRLAGALRRKGWSQEQIEIELLAANGRRCRPPLPDHEVRKIAGSVARYAPGGPDPLEIAWQATQGETYPSRKACFFGLCWHLQRARPGLPIALPLERIGALMGLHWSTIGGYRRDAVMDGVLKPVRQYIAHRRAGQYRLADILTRAIDTETLTTLTSGLVRMSASENSHSESATHSNPAPSESSTKRGYLEVVL